MPDSKTNRKSRASTTDTSSKTRKPQVRFGIGEWYGKSFAALSADERRAYASIQLREKKQAPPCPFLSGVQGRTVLCWKPGGVCSLRSYERDAATGLVTINSVGSSFRTTCPSRFEQDGTVYRWVAEVVLGHKDAIPVGQVPFLQRVPRVGEMTEKQAKEVGRIDNVLIVPNTDPLEWCPVEHQSVYFSGKKMRHDFRAMAKSKDDALPFPTVNRRPDYRSSGPKRLLPQLLVKVPTLSNWAKKMAVVVDDDFFNEFSRTISEANDLSNAQVVWFIVKYQEGDSGVRLQPSRVFMTSLDESMKGLVAAIPLPKQQFEDALRSRFQRMKL